MTALESLRCVVLGGGGFIGTNLCRKLAGRVGELKAFGRRKSFPDALDGVEWLQGDFNDPLSVAAAIEGADIVFHLINATTPNNANIDKAADLRSNVGNTIHLLEACKSAAIKRVVFVSSGGTVYGIPQEIPTAEDSPCWPITSYGISKLSVERYLHLFEYMHGLDYRVLRVSNPFGPFQTAEKNQGVIAAFARRLVAGQHLEVWGDGTVTRDYLYIDDVVDALELAAIHEGPDRIFNIGSGVGRSLNEVIETLQTIESASGLEIERREGRMVDVPVTTLDIGRAARVLGWAPRVEFADGLRRTLDWVRDGRLEWAGKERRRVVAESLAPSEE
jgi:UDP-glucose 4-epimerase